jgi:hypothetical protein
VALPVNDHFNINSRRKTSASKNRPNSKAA